MCCLQKRGSLVRNSRGCEEGDPALVRRDRPRALGALMEELDRRGRPEERRLLLDLPELLDQLDPVDLLDATSPQNSFY